MRTVRIVVTGRVQGVGFRNHTRRTADQHDVNGWVRNRDDGAVEMVLQGDENAVSAVKDAVKRGPRLSRVEDLREETVSEPETHTSFSIRR